MKDLSILIPAYNYVCTALVRSLHAQAEALGLDYEVIVGDDGSTDKAAVEQNKAINQLDNCTYIIRERNEGRSAIRNFLARQARHPWLLFLDCDMEVPDALFLKRYAEADDSPVTDGGIRVGGRSEALARNIRYLYERQAAPMHTATERARHPYRSFRTTNFMIARSAMLAHPFDERFHRYGYEDVLFGKQLQLNGIAIRHIDNPMVLTDYETNPVFISKTEEGLRTLHEFRQELQPYSTLLRHTARLRTFGLIPLVRLWHWLMGSAERRNLTGSHPRLLLFHLYRLGYYLSL